jgi:hypothetical protein
MEELTHMDEPTQPDSLQCAADMHTYKWGNIVRGVKESEIFQIGICIRCGFAFKRII